MPVQPQNTHPNALGYTGPPKVVQMSSELQAAIEAFNWRLQEAEHLLDDPQYFYTMFQDLPNSRYPHLIRSALSAYLRENRD